MSKYLIVSFQIALLSFLKKVLDIVDEQIINGEVYNGKNKIKSEPLIS